MVFKPDGDLGGCCSAFDSLHFCQGDFVAVSDLFKRFARVMPLAAMLAGVSAPAAGQSTVTPAESNIILRGLKVSPAPASNPAIEDEMPMYFAGDEMKLNPDGEMVIEGRGVVRRADTVVSEG